MNAGIHGVEVCSYVLYLWHGLVIWPVTCRRAAADLSLVPRDAAGVDCLGEEHTGV